MEIAASLIMQNGSVELVSKTTISQKAFLQVVWTATHWKVFTSLCTQFDGFHYPSNNHSLLCNTDFNQIDTHRHEPQLWSCCLRSRDAVGMPRHWTAPMGTGAVTSGSPLAAPDLSTQTLCRDTDRQTEALWFLQHSNKSISPNPQEINLKAFQ